MTLLVQIKAKQLQLRKERKSDLAASLSTLIGEAERIGKDDGNRETTEAETVAVLKKFIKNIEQTMSDVSKVSGTDAAFGVVATHLSKLVVERETLQEFLPRQFEGTALQSIVAGSILYTNANTIKDMGKVMTDLKSRYEGQFDGAEASKLIKMKLTGAV